MFEGTTDETITPETRWLPYAFKCQPGDPARRPCWMSPYHYRLDWLLWFAAMGSPRDYPWAVHLVWKLLDADPAALGLLADDPFHGVPPRYVRVELYRYRSPRSAARSGGSARASALGSRRSLATTSIYGATCDAKVG